MDAIQSKSNSGGLLFTCHVWKIPPWISPDLAPFVFFWTQRGISNRYPTKLNQKLKSHVYCLNGIFLTPTWPPAHPVLPLGIRTVERPTFCAPRLATTRKSRSLCSRGSTCSKIRRFHQQKHGKCWAIVWDLVGGSAVVSKPSSKPMCIEPPECPSCYHDDSILRAMHQK